MASLNKVMLIGNLGRDPEVRYMPNGDAVANFSIATTENYKDKNGDKQERTEWHNIVCYRRLGEIAGQYLKKGRSVYIEGKIQTRKWQDKEGKDRYTTEIIADEMKMLGGREGAENAPAYAGGGASYGGGNDYPQSAPAPAARSNTPQQSRPAQSRPVDEFEDDIPF